MKAYIYTKYGPPGVLRCSNVERPIPRDNEILVAVKAATVSAAVIWMRKGRYPGSLFFTLVVRLMFGICKPKQKILGAEFSGIVVGVGKEVTHFKAGDAVYGTTTGLRHGAYAEYVCIPERSGKQVLALKPHLLSFEQAAAIPVGAMTALQLLEKAGIKAGHTVLIYGASGSVGTYAVQIAKYFGAKVVAVCSSANFPLVSSLGADECIDYRNTDISEYPVVADIVMDAVGKINAGMIRKILSRKGKFCTVRSATKEKNDYLIAIHKMIAAHKLMPVIDKVYPLDQLAEAHQYVEQGHKKGNVVINVA